MKRVLILAIAVIGCTFPRLTSAQRTVGGESLQLDNNGGLTITLKTPPGLVGSYIWYLPPNPPPENTAFTQGGSLTGQTLRWDDDLGYWVPTSALFLSGNNVGDFVGIGTLTPNRLFEVAGTSGIPNVRMGSLSGTTGWSMTADDEDGLVMANGDGDLHKHNPLTIFNQFGWAIGGNTNPSSAVLGTLTGHSLDIRTSNTSRLLFDASGNVTLTPGAGSNVFANNIPNDNTTENVLTLDGSNRVRYRTVSSIIGVTANEGLVYDAPNIKLGALNGTTNPFAANRMVNLNDYTLTFTTAGGTTPQLVLKGSNANVGIGVANPNNFRLEVAGNVGPAANNTHSLGSVANRWQHIYAGPSSVYIGNGAGDQTKLSYTNDGPKKFNIDPDDDGMAEMKVDGDGNLEFNGALMPASSAGTAGQFLRSSGSGSAPYWESITTSAWGITGNTGTDTSSNFIGTSDNTALVFKTNNITRAKFLNSDETEDSGAFEPGRHNAYTLGTPSKRWKELYLGPSSLRIGGFSSTNKDGGSGQNAMAIDEATISYADGVLIIDKPLGSTGSMVPNNSDIFTLGDPSNRWKDLYLGPNSLHIGDTIMEATMSYDPINSLLKFNTNNTIGSSEVIMDGDGNISILGLAAGGLVKADPITGKLVIATGGGDFESPLTFDNGLTRTANNVQLGGELVDMTDIPLEGYNLTFSGWGRVGIGTSTPGNKFAVGSGSQFQVDSAGRIAAATGINSSGPITFSSLSDGLVKSDISGNLSNATAGTDYQMPLSFSNGLTESSYTVTLGGTLEMETTIDQNENNLLFTNGLVGVGTSTPNARLEVSNAQELTTFVARATGTGSGNVADFIVEDEQSGADGVEIMNYGGGEGLHVTTYGGTWNTIISGTGSSSKGLNINAAPGQEALQIDNGSVILSHTNHSSDVSLTFGGGSNAVVTINDGDAGDITLTEGINGQILYIFNGDTENTATIISGLHPNNQGPIDIEAGKTMMCIYVTNAEGSGWVTR